MSKSVLWQEYERIAGCEILAVREYDGRTVVELKSEAGAYKLGFTLLHAYGRGVTVTKTGRRYMVVREF